MEKTEIPVSGKITEITDANYLELKEALRQSDGFAMILMHPYYDDYRDDYDAETTVLLTDLLKSEKDNIPIFIFEDKPSMRVYSEIKNGSKNRSVCIIPTQAGSPHPIIGWDRLATIFKEVGVTNFVMAGKYLHYQDEEDGLADYQVLLKENLKKQGLKLDRTLAACIGIAGGVLAEKGFNIHLSELSTPLKLSDFK